MTTQYKYSTIKKELIDRIESGSCRPHDRLYSQSEIISLYKTSVTTANRVLNELVFEGYAYRIRGKGSFVAERAQTVRRLGVVVPQLIKSYNETNFGFPPTSSILLRYIQDECVRSGWVMQLYINQDTAEYENGVFKRTIADCDAILLCQMLFEQSLLPAMAEKLAMLKAAAIPALMLDTYLDDPRFDIVSMDGFDGAYRATCQLHCQGFRRIVFFGVEPENIDYGQRVRRLGYAQAMEDLKLAPEYADCSNSPGIFSARIDGIVKKIFSSGDCPAFLSDHIGRMQALCFALSRHGYDSRHPGLATFDDFPIQLNEALPILNIAQPFEEMARFSVRKIIEKSRGSDQIEHKLFKATLNVGSTVVYGRPLDRVAVS